jgi:hypothetical protein
MQNHLRNSIVFAALCAGSFAGPAFASPGDPVPAVAEVLARERAWLDSFDQATDEVLVDVLADDFVGTAPDGHTASKADVVARQRRPRAPGEHLTFTTQGTVAKVRDGVVVLVGHVFATRIDAQGKTHHDAAAYTDTWVREAGTWRVLTAQATHLPPAP